MKLVIGKEKTALNKEKIGVAFDASLRGRAL